jgi:hypothetical protein
MPHLSFLTGFALKDFDGCVVHNKGFTVLFKRPAPAVTGAGRMRTKGAQYPKVYSNYNPHWAGKKTDFDLPVFVLA